jgi:ankyrin repeat protein
MPDAAGTCASLGSVTIYREADNYRSGSFVCVPNELKLMIADCLDLDDINSLIRTCGTENRLLTPYMYRRAKGIATRHGRPCFLKAVDAGNVTAVMHFIKVGTSVNMSHKSEYLRPTALHCCVQDGNIEIAQLLIQHGVKMSPVNDFGWTPLHCAVARAHSSRTWVRLLLDAGADISATSEMYGSILYTATMRGTPSIVQLLLQRGATPTTMDSDGDTLLHCSQWDQLGTEATVGLFLDAGVNIEATNKRGRTPLHQAAKYGREDYVKELLKWGAHVDATDNKGRTPLQAFLKWRPISSAARHILHHDALPAGCASKGREACVPSCRFVENVEPVVDLLLSAGADIRASRNSTRSPLDWAASWFNM